MERHELAIVRTVVYAALFDYPLTLDQLRESLIGVAMTREEILALYENSASLRATIEQRDGFFFPAGRGDLVSERRQREARSRAFLARHERLLQWICAIPFTRMVALSGSIAHLNLDEHGDLDLFIVTRGRRVWTVSVAAIVLTRLLGVRRIVCANFVMADTHLRVESPDLFTANQILHLKPLIGDEVLDGFLAANPFVRRFYPNARATSRTEFALRVGRPLRTIKKMLEALLTVPSRPIEAICRRAYAWHLRRRSQSWQSPEQVRLQADYLKLHTRSHRQSVLARFDDSVDEALGQKERAAIA
jgi:hypothetical protein